MSVLASVSKMLPSMDSPDRNFVREAWDRMSTLPGGKWAFSKLIGRMAAYTGTIDARVEHLEIGRSRVVLEDKPGVRNHLKSVHAVALVNLAELTGNVALAYSLPNNARFIVAGLSIEYLKKSRGRITGHCECPVITSAERKEYPVAVTMLDESGEEVAACVLRTLVGPKPGVKVESRVSNGAARARA